MDATPGNTLTRPRLPTSRIRSARRRQYCLSNPAQYLRLRRRAFIHAMDRGVLAATSEPTFATPPSPGPLHAFLASPSTAVGVVVTLIATVLFLAPRSPLPWVDASRAATLLAGLAYFGWYLRDEGRLDRLRGTCST